MEMGGGGATGGPRSGRKPDQGNAGRRSTRETAVDESWKEMADRVARHQADLEVVHAYATRTANYNSAAKLVRTRSSFVFFFLFALDPL